MTPDELYQEYVATITRVLTEFDARADAYRGAISRLHDALRRGLGPAELWRAAAAACDAEMALTGECEGPAGRLYDELGIPDCYTPGEPCGAESYGSEYCRTRCQLFRQNAKIPG